MTFLLKPPLITATSQPESERRSAPTYSLYRQILPQQQPPSNQVNQIHRNKILINGTGFTNRGKQEEKDFLIYLRQLGADSMLLSTKKKSLLIFWSR
jgi:hypothetical protein